MIIVGVGGVLTSLTSTSFTLRNMLPLLTCCTCSLTRFCWISCVNLFWYQGFPHKRFKMAQVRHKQNIFTKTYHVRGRLWGKSYRTIVAGAQQIDGTWKHFRKWRPMSMLHKKINKCTQKRYTWAYCWAWCHNAALLQSVAPALPQALWHWSVEKREKLDEWMSAWYDSDDWKS